MIQRIQSLYIIVSFVFSCVLLYFSLQLSTDLLWAGFYQLNYGFWIIPIAIITVLFLFKKRPLQSLLCLLILFLHVLQGAFFIPGFDFSDGFDFEEFVIFVSLVNVVLLWLARRSIRKDEDLVRSVDRIR